MASALDFREKLEESDLPLVGPLVRSRFTFYQCASCHYLIRLPLPVLKVWHRFNLAGASIQSLVTRGRGLTLQTDVFRAVRPAYTPAGGAHTTVALHTRAVACVLGHVACCSC